MENKKKFYQMRMLGLIILLVISVILGIYALQRLVIMPSFISLERAEAEKDLSRCVDAIKRETHHLNQLCADWATWDDTYQFAQDKNEAFLKANINWENLEANSSINSIVIVGVNGEIIWGESFDSSQGGNIEIAEFQDKAFSEGHYLLDHKSKESRINGLILTSHGLMIVSSQPILTSKGEGPVEAVLVMGRFLNQNVLKALNEQVKVPFLTKVLNKDTVLTKAEKKAVKLLVSEPYVIESINQNELHGYSLISDLNGSPALLVNATFPREIIKRGRDTARLAGLTVVLALVLVVAVSFFWSTLRLYETRRYTEKVEGLVVERTAELVESEEQFRTVVEQSTAAIEVYEPNGKMVIVNDAWAKFWNLKKDDVTNFNIFDDSQCEAIGLTAAFREAQKGNSQHIPEVAYDPDNSGFKDGRSRWISARVYPIKDQDGKVLNIVLTYDDITDRKISDEALKKSEHMQRKMVANIGDVIVIIDKDGSNKYKSPNIEKIFGWKPEDVVGQSAFDNVHPEDLKNAQEFFGDLTSEPNKVGSFECRYRCKNGNYKWIEFTGNNLLEDPDIKGILGNYQDISERKQLEERFRQMQKMDAIGQLAGGVAHDFNNQLTGILGYADILRSQLKDDKHLHYVENILSGSHRAADLNKKLLAFARKGKYESVIVDIHNVIREVVEFLEHSIDKKIEVKLLFNATPSFTRGDPSQIQNAFLNLAINASDAMTEGGHIIFETDTCDLGKAACDELPFELLPGPYLHISVIDSGGGIQDDVLKHIFEPFFTTKELGKGTGMGLAAVYGTVKQHGGAISVSSKKDKGTTFDIYFPLEEETVQEKRSKKGFTVAPRNARILLVEDEEVIRNLATDMLNSFGYMVETREDGLVGVEYYSKHWQEIDLVILDLIMPGMSGPEAYYAMKDINPQIKTLISSGYSIDGIAQKLLDDGAQDFIQKPFQLAELSAKIAGVLES